MSVQTQIDRISGAVSAALAALTEKGVTVPAGTKVDGLAALIAAIESGGGTDFEVKNGTFTPSSNVKNYDVTHNLGRIPKIVGVFLETSTKHSDIHSNGYFIGVVCVGSVMFGLRTYNSRGEYSYLDKVLTYDFTLENDGDFMNYPYCYLRNANENTFNVGATQGNGKLYGGKRYRWVVGG